jgi:uroporphyrinogen-III synthase
MSIKIKRILISQPEPTTEKSPYTDLAEKYGLKLDFHQFIRVEGISAKEFRNQRINILDHFAIVFTSKTGIDNFFRIVEELKIAVPETMKYFCISESVAFYLQKYIVYRKRKIFYGETGLFKDIVAIMLKQQLASGRFLLVLSDVYKAEIPQQMDKAKFKYTKGIFYKTVSSDLSSVDIKSYDILAFFSPQGIKSLFYNFPDFKQGNTIIAAFGPTTAKAVKEARLTLNIPVPTPEALSMPSALELFIKQQVKPAKAAAKDKSAKQPEETAKQATKPAKPIAKSDEPAAVKSPKPAITPAKSAVKPAVAKSSKLAAKPAKSAVKPAVVKSSKPAAKPAKSAVKPAVAKSSKPAAKPAKSDVKLAAVKSSKPAAKPAKSAVKPAAVKSSKPIAKPAKSAVKPAAVKSSKPIAKPAKSAVKPAAVKPSKPTAKPAKLAVKPTKPAAKSTKPTLKPAKQPASSAKQAAKSVAKQSLATTSAKQPAKAKPKK